MKKGIIMVAMLLATVSVSAQFYMSASGGYSIPSAGVKFGTETTPSQELKIRMEVMEKVCTLN
ncbi:hypothetical protein [Tenacibaculum maritimum]|uniref:hypothetical protein n=1 Tax=Tenacibaculum maritimum TaxID=107401 RepID=UPI003877777F